MQKLSLSSFCVGICYMIQEKRKSFGGKEQKQKAYFIKYIPKSRITEFAHVLCTRLYFATENLSFLVE